MAQGKIMPIFNQMSKLKHYHTLELPQF